MTLEKAKRKRIIQAFQQAKGQPVIAAAELGISTKTLYRELCSILCDQEKELEILLNDKYKRPTT